MKNFSAWSQSSLFCLVPEPTQFGRSQSWLRDLGLPEPEAPKNGAAPQHCRIQEVRNILKKTRKCTGSLCKYRTDKVYTDILYTDILYTYILYTLYSLYAIL